MTDKEVNLSDIKVVHKNSLTNSEVEGYTESFSDISPSANVARPPKDQRLKYNIISWLCFLWLEPLLWLGLRKGINQNNLYPHPPEADSEKLLKIFNRLWKVELLRKKDGKRPRLLLTMLRCLLWKFLLHGLLLFIETALFVMSSVFLGYLTEILVILNPSDEETRNSYLFALGLVLCGVILTFVHAHCFLLGYKLGMMSRIIMTAVIYQKVTSLSQVMIRRLSVGRIVNLASNDVQRFDLAFLFVHVIWIAPIHLSVATYLVYLEVGYSCFIMTGFILIQIPLLILFAKMFARLRFKSALLTDKRIKIMNEIISGIKVIKLYAWEYAFKAVVQKLRRMESMIIFKGGIVRAISLGFMIVSIILMTFIVFSTYTGTDGVLTPKKVFTVLSLLNFLRLTSVHFVVQTALAISEGRVALTRIQQLLDVEDLDMEVLDDNVTFETSPDEVSVTVNDVSASWTYDATNKVLDRVSFKVTKESQLLSVVGHVGAGKSSLLQCLLRELRPIEGTMKMNGRLSYTSQEPWLFSASLRDNILFGNLYDPDRYNTVIEACALVKDLKQLVDRDMTLVGERGVTLSGGQKARVSLARAVYHDADIYLLDDPLSAVDTAVAKHLFEKCIRGVLKDKLVVLVTHQVQFALQSDQVLGLNEGRVELYGEVNELLAKDINLKHLLGLLESDDKKGTHGINSIKSVTRGEKRQIATPVSPLAATCVKLSESPKNVLASHLSNDPSYMLDSDEPHPDATLTPAVSMSSRTLSSESILLDSPPKRFKNEASDRYNNIIPSINFEPSMFDTSSLYSSPSLYSIHSETATQKYRQEEYIQTITLPPEEKSHGSVSFKTYVQFFRAGGSVLVLLLMITVFIMGEVSLVTADWWISDWSQCSQFNGTKSENRSSCLLSTEERIGIFGGVTAATVILNFTRTVLFYAICINASRVLHNRMFRSVLRSPMLFFDTNPIGRVLNRFTKDVGFLDDLLPYVFLEFLLWLSRVSSILITAIVAIPWLIFPFALLLVLFIAIRFYYIKTAREIKRLEAIARSPVYSHISTTLQGLPIIRSFGKMDVALDQFHVYQNHHTKSYFLYIALTRWLGVRLDSLTNIVLVIIAFSAIPLSTVFDPALIGLALTYAVSLNGLFQYTVRLSADVENIMISGERIMEYSRLDQEASLETQPDDSKPAVDWPMEGRIEMDNVTFQYSSKLPLVLNNLTFTVHPGEKVGVVGRTGAGKSSLLSVLFRLAEPHGQIIIDGVDIQRIGLHDLRSKISIIPQDPVLFSGTMRYNLDPFEEFSDSHLWDALEQVQLKVAVEQLEGQLSGEVSEGGSNFSVGQKQLVCLARALLRKNKILILDEATANVDVGTDAIIQQMIREMFSKCTIITIAHRLNTIMDSDRILVLSNGLIKEFDSPYNLLQDSNSLFVEMIEQTGHITARKLRQMVIRVK